MVDSASMKRQSIIESLQFVANVDFSASVGQYSYFPTLLPCFELT